MATLFDTGIFSVEGLAGQILPGATLGFFASGTSTPLATYSDNGLTTPNANPVIAFADGRFGPIFLQAASYKIVLKDPDGTTLMTRDPIDGEGAQFLVDELLTDLAAGDGAGLVGFSHLPPGAAGTVAKKLQQVVSPFDAPYSATGGDAPDSTSPTNAAIATVGQMGSIFVPAGSKLRVTSLTNPRGVRGVGGGQIVIGSGSAAIQKNDYARAMDFVVGREYAYRLYQRAAAAGTTLVGFMYGDSTVAHGAAAVTGSITSNVLTVTADNGGTNPAADGSFYIGCTITGSGVGASRTVTGIQKGFGGNGIMSVSAGANVASTVISTAGNGGGYAGSGGAPDVLLNKSFRRQGVRNAISLTNRAVGGTSWSDANPVSDVGPTTDIMFFKFSINHVSGQDVDAEITAMRAKLAAVRAQAFGAVNLLTIVLVGPSSTYDPSGGRTSVWYELLRQGYEQAARDYQCVYIDLYGLFQDSTWWAASYADTPAVHPNGFLQQQLWAYVTNALLPTGALALSTYDDWIGLSGQNSWVDYSPVSAPVGYAPFSASLSPDGWVRLRGAVKSGTPTAAQAIAALPNQNYYPPYNTGPFVVSTFNGSTWGQARLNVDVDGTIRQTDGNAQTNFTSLEGIFYRVW